MKHRKKKRRRKTGNKKGSDATKNDIDNANKYIADNTNNVTIMMHPTMLVYFTLLVPKEHDELMMYLADVNHNIPNGNKVMKLMNNMLDNPLRSNEAIDKDWGLDTQLFVNPYDKVSFHLVLSYTTQIVASKHFYIS